MDGVKLKFTRGRARHRPEALKRKSGARGLRAILENAMLDIMYEIPSRTASRGRRQRGGHHPHEPRSSSTRRKHSRGA
jgi:ATP-dependent protease Clp ATPase subunit